MRPDYKKWGEKETWSVEEAAHLLLDQNPEHSPAGEAGRYADLVQLKLPNLIQQIQQKFGADKVAPIPVLEWGLKNGHEPVQKLISAIQEYGQGAFSAEFNYHYGLLLKIKDSLRQLNQMRKNLSKEAPGYLDDLDKINDRISKICNCRRELLGSSIGGSILSLAFYDPRRKNFVAKLDSLLLPEQKHEEPESREPTEQIVPPTVLTVLKEKLSEITANKNIGRMGAHNSAIAAVIEAVENVDPDFDSTKMRGLADDFLTLCHRFNQEYRFPTGRTFKEYAKGKHSRHGGGQNNCSWQRRQKSDPDYWKDIYEAMKTTKS